MDYPQKFGDSIKAPRKRPVSAPFWGAFFLTNPYGLCKVLECQNPLIFALLAFYPYKTLQVL
ncbi:hypothetical protein TPY_2767 [Sulfobacillus acidophilus TPY]|nr:hypothetical protein TPY_2767 [Sulfobacillus acidophilus TPY]